MHDIEFFNAEGRRVATATDMGSYWMVTIGDRPLRVESPNDLRTLSVDPRDREFYEALKAVEEMRERHQTLQDTDDAAAQWTRIGKSYRSAQSMTTSMASKAPMLTLPAVQAAGPDWGVIFTLLVQVAFCLPNLARWKQQHFGRWSRS